MMRFASLAAVSALVASSIAFSLTSAQVKELHDFGKITVLHQDGPKKGQPKGEFKVRVVPGQENIERDMQKVWAGIADRMDDFVDPKGFWKDTVYTYIADGYDGVKKSVGTYGIGAIPEDFRDTQKSNAEAVGHFGARATAVKNWAGFSLMAVGRVLATVAGVGASVAYALAGPVYEIVKRPLVSGTAAVTAGTVVPAIRFVWNEAAVAWLKSEGEPRPGDVTVTYYEIDDSEVSSVAEQPTAESGASQPAPTLADANRNEL